jgi:hypothetical protein
MTTFLLVCALVGGGVVVLQLVLGLLGLGHGDVPHDVQIAHVDHTAEHAAQDAHDAHDAGHALHLTSLRALAAGLAFFGLTGYGLLRAGWSAGGAVGLALVAGAVAVVVVAVLLRLLLRFESDGAVQIENALWQPATVYVPIPGAKAGAGKVTLSLQGRLVEYQAVTSELALPTGAAVTVVDVVSSDTLEVVRTPATPLD